MEATKYIPLNFAILAVPYNWFLVAAIGIFLVLATRLISSDQNGILTPVADATTND